jgi:TetR/AcrR family transcriptional regulator
MNSISSIWQGDGGGEREIVQVRRRQERSIEKRSKILAAAAQEFADQGFEGTTTRSIGRRANVRHALVIYHFETKLSLWQAVMRDMVRWFQDEFTTRLEDLNGLNSVAKLQGLQAAFIRMSAEHPQFHWLMSHEAGTGGERLDWLMEHLLSNSFDTFRDLIVKAQAAKCYVQGDPNHLHYLFLGAAARIFMLASEVKMVTGRSPFEPDFVETHIALCRELFFREPPTRSSRRTAKDKV